MALHSFLGSPTMVIYTLERLTLCSAHETEGLGIEGLGGSWKATDQQYMIKDCASCILLPGRTEAAAAAAGEHMHSSTRRKVEQAKSNCFYLGPLSI